MVDLSITIVAYNNYMDIIKALDSLMAFTSSDIKKQVYIVDNNAKNEEQNELRQKFFDFIQDNNEIIYLDTGANLGFGKGHNYILDKIDSKYHAIVNPDIIFVEDVFSGIINFIEQQNIGMCIPKIIDEQGNIQEVYRRELTIWDMFIRMFIKKGFNKRKAYHTMQDMSYNKPFNVPFGQGSFLVVKTELFKQLNGFDDRYFMYLEDADLCKRVNQVDSLMYFPDAKVIHKWEKGSHKNKTLLKYHLNSMREYFKKWGFKFC